MEGTREELNGWKRQSEEGEALQKRLDGLMDRRGQLCAEARERKSRLWNARYAVEELEGWKPQALFSRLTGQHGKKMEQARLEVHAAQSDYDAITREIEDLDRQAQALREELEGVRTARRRYAQALEERQARIRQAGGAPAEELARLQERDARLEQRSREVQEAIRAGSGVVSTATGILESLEKAKKWGTLDLLGGGVVSSMAKHGHLDTAQEAMDCLKRSLARFQTELMDVKEHAEFDVQVGDFLKFADFFLDGILADWVVQSRISRAQEQVRQLCGRAAGAVRELEQTDRRLKGERMENRARLEELTLEGCTAPDGERGKTE